MTELLSTSIVVVSLWPVNDVDSAEPTNAAAVCRRLNYEPDRFIFKKPLHLSHVKQEEFAPREVGVIRQVRICPGNSCLDRDASRYRIPVTLDSLVGRSVVTMETPNAIEEVNQPKKQMNL